MIMYRIRCALPCCNENAIKGSIAYLDKNHLRTYDLRRAIRFNNKTKAETVAKAYSTSYDFRWKIEKI